MINKNKDLKEEFVNLLYSRPANKIEEEPVEVQEEEGCDTCDQEDCDCEEPLQEEEMATQVDETPEPEPQQDAPAESGERDGELAVGEGEEESGEAVNPVKSNPSETNRKFFQMKKEKPRSSQKYLGRRTRW